ncbi:MAG: hypothetical protein KJ042_00680 [Deltaproteobacteria bacterium]|nr:hypothetical protein [Deltaproteobacteria bacterium]
MRRLWVVVFALLIPFAFVAAIGGNTVISAPAPDCIEGGEEALFQISVAFRSPDGETLRFVDVSFGDSWELGTMYSPPPQSISGSWTATAYPNGNGVQWVFNRTSGPGGGLADGETAVFSFRATPVNPNENQINVVIEGDVASPTPPHEMSASFTYEICEPTDDDTDDDADDDVDDDVDDDADDDTGGDFSATLDFTNPVLLTGAQIYDFEFIVANTTTPGPIQRWINSVDLYMPSEAYVIDAAHTPDALHWGTWAYELLPGDLGDVGIRWAFTSGGSSAAYGDIREGESLEFAFRATTDAEASDGFDYRIAADSGEYVSGTACVVEGCDETDDDADDDADDDLHPGDDDIADDDADDDAADDDDDDDDDNDSGGCGC